MASFGGDQAELSVKDLEEMLVATMGKVEGTDTNDKVYNGLQELWESELSVRNQEPACESELAWYGQAYSYWESEEKCPISDDGVLGGYGALTPVDVASSREFLAQVNRDLTALSGESLRFDVACDCGAGIGRVSKHLLLPLYREVHLVEQAPRLLNAAPKWIAPPDNERIKLIRMGMQDFNPASEGLSYDCIWIQWVVGHLTDTDFLSFFRRCRKALRPGGVICLKDNVADGWAFVVDKDDSSVARARPYMQLLLTLAGLTVVREERQVGFPDELCPVYMWCLRPGAQIPQVS